MISQSEKLLKMSDPTFLCVGKIFDRLVETVEAILKLDLMINSEYQIFGSIMKWVNNDVDSRKELLPQLLNCIRWSYMDFGDISRIKDNELIRNLPNFDLVKSSYVGFNRIKQNYFVYIHERGDSILSLKAFDNDFFCFTIGDFTRDESMSLEFVHGEHISDILFDSGRKGIRVNWAKKTFRWLNFEVAGKTYYSHLMKFIVQFSNSRTFICCLDDKDFDLPQPIPDENLFLEHDGKFLMIGKTKDDKKWFGIFPVDDQIWFNNYKDHEQSFHATFLDNTVYLLTKDLEFIQFNCGTRSFDKNDPFKEKKLNFDDLILTSHQTNDDKVILIDKSSGKVFVFHVHTKRWVEKCRIMNLNLCTDSGSSSNKLLAFASTFLPMPVIEPMYEHIDH